jgi:hypothetical protein
MIELKDKKGAPLPEDDIGPKFDADLMDYNNGEGPMLEIGVPKWFTVWKTDSREDEGSPPAEEFRTCGVLQAPLEKILDEYLHHWAEGFDEGKAAPAFLAWLRNYADRLDKAIGSMSDTGPPSTT